MATCKASAAPNLTEPEAEAEPIFTSAGPVGPEAARRQPGKVNGGIYRGYNI